MIVTECKKDCWCSDCTDQECVHAGKAYADCPRYECIHESISEGFLECESCGWLAYFKEKMREKDAENRA